MNFIRDATTTTRPLMEDDLFGDQEQPCPPFSKRGDHQAEGSPMSDDGILKSDGGEPPEEQEFEDDDSDSVLDGKYGFEFDDQHMLQFLAPAVRLVLARADIKPRQIAELGAFLYAVDRLPMVTGRISMALRLAYRVNHECSYMQIRVDENSFSLETGGYTHDPHVGGDSYGETIFEADAGGGREGDALRAADFLESFQGAAGAEHYKVEIDEDTGLPFDEWDQDTPADPWEGL